MSSRLMQLTITLAGALSASFIAASLPACGSDSSGGQVEQGQQAVTANKCTMCHGANLAGDTNPQPGTTAYPANLTPDSATGIGDWTTDQIVNAILNGIDDDSAALCTTMPKFAAQGMTLDQATAIAAYLKSIPAVTKEIPESVCAGKPAAGK